MLHQDQLSHAYINVIDPPSHQATLTRENIARFTDGFSRPALFRQMLVIEEKLAGRAFYEAVDGRETLQWRVKHGEGPVSMRAEDGSSDYNYVTGKLGTGTEFLDDIFERRLDVYSHLGTISSGYNDPYEWGKLAFNRLKDELFRSGWCQVPGWRVSGHMFFGHSNQEYGEPSRGAVGSDWHMFPTLNIFVMVAGCKRWMTRPPRLGEQFEEYDRLFSSSSGREAPGASFEHDLVYLEPGDVLLNLPFEWHKVLNGRGLSIGAAFRVIDDHYLQALSARGNLDVSRVDVDADPQEHEELAHFLTSLGYASRHLPRAQMMLNDLEYAYLRRRGGSGSVRVERL